MSSNNFKPRKFEDHSIVGADGKVVGHIRIKPSGVLWAPSNAKSWYGVKLKDFAEFMERTGKRKEK